MTFEFITYEKREHVARLTINRPQVMNALHPDANEELARAWDDFAADPDAWVAILTGAGEKAFSAGNDLKWTAEHGMPRMPATGFGGITARFDLWKPVIAAVNGMACGGAFYMLGEVEFIIAAEHATFFDPHVTYGMTAAFEPIHMHDRMPFGEIMRLSLLGNHERLSARRAYEIGLVSEVVAAGDLHDATAWAAGVIASQPQLAIQGTVRAIWAARELSNRQAVALGYAFVGLGTSQDSIAEGQKLFESGTRVEWRLR